jgi:hypothetical protein
MAHQAAERQGWFGWQGLQPKMAVGNQAGHVVVGNVGFGRVGGAEKWLLASTVPRRKSTAAATRAVAAGTRPVRSRSRCCWGPECRDGRPRDPSWPQELATQSRHPAQCSTASLSPDNPFEISSPIYEYFARFKQKSPSSIVYWQTFASCITFAPTSDIFICQLSIVYPRGHWKAVGRGEAGEGLRPMTLAILSRRFRVRGPSVPSIPSCPDDTQRRTHAVHERIRSFAGFACVANRTCRQPVTGRARQCS